VDKTDKINFLISIDLACQNKTAQKKPNTNNKNSKTTKQKKTHTHTHTT